MSTSSEQLHVLVSLHKGYGLGDAVQISAVLRHLAKHRPNWFIDYQAEPGRHEVGREIVGCTFAYGEPYPAPRYDAEVQIVLFDTWANWQDRPNTRVASCLHERFGLPWDAECGRYVVNVRPEVTTEVERVMTTFVPGIRDTGKPIVGIHYKGDSSPAKKDLSDAQAAVVCDHVLAMGRVPLVFDWRGVCPLAAKPGVCTTGGKAFSREWGRSAEYNCAVIRRCEAFVGIDSGPGKCASSTDIPTLITWTRHHPAPFHDPAANTTHLVQVGYNGLDPVCNDPGVVAWFEAHHRVLQYDGDPVYMIKTWLNEMLV